MNYHRILCAVDFSDASEEIFARALALSQVFKAELTLIHVVEHFPEDLPLALGAREDEDPQKYLVDLAHQRLAALRERLGTPEVQEKVVVSHRSARHEIVEAALHINADLLVVGGTGHHLLSHLGSTAAGLLHAGICDLLVVKPLAGG